MHTAPAAAQSYRMLQMQHLVIKDVVHSTPRHSRMVENPAYHNRIVRRIVVSQAIPRMIAAPGHLRTRHQPMKEPRIQLVKNRFKIVDSSFGCVDALASAHLPQEMRLLADVMTGHVSSLSRRVLMFNRLAIHLGKQDVGNRVQYRIGRSFEQIRKPHWQPSLAQPDCIIDVGECDELNREFRDGRAGPQLAVTFLEDWEKTLAHAAATLALSVHE